MIFVSRTLGPASPLRRWAAARGWALRAESLLRFAPVAYDSPAGAEWWFCYSPRAAEFALGQHRPPPTVRLAALGAGTARRLTELLDRPVDFCGHGQPPAVAAEFLKVAHGRAVFFPRARQSRLTVQTLLANHLRVLDAVCYDNVAAPPAGPIVADCYVFTSPLNVAAYLDHYALAPGARVLAIGPSTGAALRRRGVGCAWPAVPGEEALVDLLSATP